MKKVWLLESGKTPNNHNIQFEKRYKMQIFIRFILIVSFLGVFVFASKPNTPNKSEKYKVQTYVLDTAISKLHWNCAHIGKIKFKSGTITMLNNEPDEINLNIDMTSITNSDIDNKLLQGTLENVLKSVEFFNTEIYPEARFESHSIKKINNEYYSFEGDFIIFDNGICQEFNGTITIEEDKLYFNTKTINLDRTDWGIYYLSANNPTPRDEEKGFAVTDTLLLDAHIVAYKK
jgi:polyisoprenoid-binding protein YceI